MGLAADLSACLALGVLLAGMLLAGRAVLGGTKAARFVLDVAGFALAAVLLCGFSATRSAAGALRWYMLPALAAGLWAGWLTLGPAVLYAARLAMGCGKDAAYLKRLMGMRTDYQARAVFDEARRITLPWCENALEVCCQTDARLKSTGAQDTELMAELIVRIMGEQAACARG